MNLTRLGSATGGWVVDLDLVPDEGVVVDCGVGADVSFAEALHELRPGLKFVLVDHTDESRVFVESRGHDWVTFLKKAVAPSGVQTVKMHRHKTRSGSESCSHTHRVSDVNSTYDVPAVSLRDLVARHHPCLVKMDIESAEYETLHECVGVQQVCCEFHHRMDPSYTVADTARVVSEFTRVGYVVAHVSEHDEYLLVKR